MGYVPQQEYFLTLDERFERSGPIETWSRSERTFVYGARFERGPGTDQLFEDAPDGGMQPAAPIRAWLAENDKHVHVDFLPPRDDPFDKLGATLHSWSLSAKFDSEPKRDAFVQLCLDVSRGRR